MMPFAFEVQDRVHDVLQHLGSGEAAILRHMTDEHCGDVLILGGKQELCRRLANLADAAWR